MTRHLTIFTCYCGAQRGGHVPGCPFSNTPLHADQEQAKNRVMRERLDAMPVRAPIVRANTGESEGYRTWFDQQGGIHFDGLPDVFLPRPFPIRMATLTAGPRGSMGEEVAPAGFMPTDFDARGYATFKPEPRTALGLTRAEADVLMLPKYGPRTWQHDETGRTTQAADSPGPRWALVGSMPRDSALPGANEFTRMQDAYREAEEPTCGLAALGKALADYAQACDEADRAEIERINVDGARAREALRHEPSYRPWDMAAGEAS